MAMFRTAEESGNGEFGGWEISSEVSMGKSSKHGGFSIAMFAYQVQAGLVEIEKWS